MIVYVANPLYDAVFKYLMEDDRIAKTILTALLKKKVVDVKMRRNEYANLTRRESISMFRIDFAATVLDENGTPRLMLIELQKTWLPTETLRFRRYLALQYNNEENMLQEEHGKYAIPMVAIYLLGHRVGNITEPIVYVNHNAYDYDGKLVVTGMPDPFVDSLQHDSIIVQIPLLHGRVNNSLEKVLSLFDQTNVAEGKKVIKVDDNQYEGDNEMEYIVRRLQSAAADPDMRYQMNAEDEFFKELEDRDTAIMERDEHIKQQNEQIKWKDEQLNQQEGQLKQQEGQLKQQEGQLKQQEGQLKQQEGQLKQQEGQLKQQEGQLKQQEGQLKQQELMLRTMIIGMQERGMQLEDIAKMLGKPMEEVKKLIID